MGMIRNFALVLLAFWAATAAEATPPSPRQPTNAAGQPVRAVDGKRINYTRHDLKPMTARSAPGTAARGALPRAEAATLASWGYAAFGSGIGAAGLVTTTVNGSTEVFATGSTQTFGIGTYWHAQRWNRSRNTFDTVYVSDLLSAGIARLLVARTGPGGAPQIVVGLLNGMLRFHDLQTKALVATTDGACASRGGLRTLAAADLDGNGNDELLSLCADDALTAEGAVYAAWVLAGVGGNELAVGQMDDDAALEIASTSGRVVDSATRAVQWAWPAGFGAHVLSADIDGDGRDELIAADAWYWIYGYDVERQLPSWSLRAELDVGAIALADVNRDGQPDLLVGDGQWGQVSAYRTDNRQLIGAIGNPEHGVTQIATADLDGDGAPELLWGSGATSTGPDHLYVGHWATLTIRWQNPDLVGPFIGPLVGDLDGDGIPEAVVVSTFSDATYGSGRILVFDSRTMVLRAVSQAVAGNFAWLGINDVKLRDIDGDGRIEVLIGADRLYDGLVEAWRFNADNSFSLHWTNTVRPPGSRFQAVEAVDVDGDGRPEVLGAAGGAQGSMLYAYDSLTGAEKWRTLNYAGDVLGLSLGDFDGDGQTDIAVAVRGRGVWIFAASTAQLKAIIDAPLISSLTRLDAHLPQRLLVGHSDGRAVTHAFDGGAQYPAVQSLQLVSTAIDAIEVGRNRTWWVASGGRLMKFGRSTMEYQSADYGPGFGRRVDSIGTRGSVFSGGRYGLLRLDVVP